MKISHFPHDTEPGFYRFQLKVDDQRIDDFVLTEHKIIENVAVFATKSGYIPADCLISVGSADSKNNGSNQID